MAYQADGGLAVALEFGSSTHHSTGRVGGAARSPAAFHNRRVSPEQVLKSFSTRSFRRERPGNPELLLEIAADCVASHRPIPFMMYWGKGLRPLLAAPEYKCLDYLASMLARIKECYGPGASMALVFTDTHAKLNGHSPSSIQSYYNDLYHAARQRGFTVQMLSTMMAEVELPEPNAAEEMPSPELLASLSVSAAKWFRGEGTPQEGAIRYYRANMLERQVIEQKFPRSIFVTFNGSILRPLFPRTMPIFYMYSLRHGVSDKPWFLPPDLGDIVPGHAIPRSI